MSRACARLAGIATILLLGATTNPGVYAQAPGEGGQRPGPGGRGGRGLPIVAALDADANGEISAAEIEGAAAALKALDKNKDGKLAADELLPTGGRRGPGGREGGGPGAREGRGGPSPGEAAGGGGGGASDSGPAAPAGTDEAEKKILAVIQDVNQNQRGGTMIVPEVDGRMLRTLAEAVQAKKIVEIGTSVGHSGLWFCLALRKTGGKLITHDIDEGRASRARENFKAAGVDGMVTLVLGDAHAEVTKVEGPVDLVFIDAEKEGYTDYLKKVLPLLKPEGLILAHNMNMRRGGGGTSDYLQALYADPSLQTVILSPPGSGGLSVTQKKR